LTINKKNFRSTLVALAFGVLVTVVPASADTISLAVAGSPQNVLVGGYSWSLTGSTVANDPIPAGGLYVNGMVNGVYNPALNNTLGFVSGNSVGAGAPATQSEVVDITLTPTTSAGKQAAVTFQGFIQENTQTSQYSLVFGSQNSTGCSNTGSASCFITGNGNQITNGQQIVTQNGVQYTELTSNGMTYEVQTQTTLQGGNKLNWLNGFVGVSTAPEPATYATTGLAAAFLGLFLRRKAKKA